MNKIQYVTGDLINSNIIHIAHGCNAQGVMRSGVAKSIRQRYPKAYEDYYNKYVEQNNSLTPGQVIYSTQPDGRVVLNLITQEFYGRDPNRRYVDYEAIRNCIKSINLMSDCKGFYTVAFPLIGAGLANGNWSIISDIIETTATFDPVVYTLDGIIP